MSDLCAVRTCSNPANEMSPQRLCNIHDAAFECALHQPDFCWEDGEHVPLSEWFSRWLGIQEQWS